MWELIVEWNDGSSAHSVDQWPFCERLRSSDEAGNKDIAVLEPAEPILEVLSFAAHHHQQQTVQEEVAEIGTLFDLLPCSPDSESDSDYVSDCEF